MSIKINSNSKLTPRDEHILLNDLHEIEQLAPFGSDIIFNIDKDKRIDIKSNHVSFVSISNEDDIFLAIKSLKKDLIEQIANWKKTRFDKENEIDPIDVNDDFLKDK